jgi:hypothetical protein
MTPVNGDILSTSSLLFAVVAAFYSLWYAEVCRARDVEVKSHLDDRGPAISLVSSTLKTKAVPLLIGVALLVLIFTPNVTDVVVTSALADLKSPSAAIRHYSAVRTAFIFIWISELVLLGLSCALVYSLRKKLVRLRQPTKVQT